VRRAHGLHGDVFVQLISDRRDRVAPGRTFWTDRGELTVVRHRTAANGRHVVGFATVADRTAAERLANCALYAAPLDDATDELWVHELIGRSVVDQHGVARGVCTAVVANPAADLLELDSGALVPSNFIDGLDGATIRVAVPDGLFDLVDDPP
jgi:16S rRNA processing protein RimM